MKGLYANPIQPEVNRITDFMLRNLSLFLSRFSLSYFKEDCCIEYFISRHASFETISSSLAFSFCTARRGLHVSKFYPELYLQINSKYMSAACFCLLIHHCAQTFSADGSCRITLETVPVTSDAFYCKLKDFHFHVIKHGLGNVVELESDLSRTPIDRGVITKHVFEEGELPFMR